MARRERLGFIQTATIVGIRALPVTVEVSVCSGLPGISIVGMPDIAVQEARLRVRLALRAAGFEVPSAHIVVNLAPSALKKIGSGFDLPIALGLLVATGQVSPAAVEGLLCVGELSLDATVKPVKGLLAYEQAARELGIGLLTAPVEQGFPGSGQLRHVCLRSIGDLTEGEFSQPLMADTAPAPSSMDYAEVAGNDTAKRALQIAAAGSHGILMIGPPGSGKSMLASRLPTILPPLNEDECIESALVHSVAGLPYREILHGGRPFRAPHHSASRAGLLGGGSPPAPGEVSLAHNGVLFLDEMPEFGTSVLQLLRQPVEQGTVSLARAGGTATFPARFVLVGAANPCPCGYYGDALKHCTCPQPVVSRYQGRIGGPLMDRFDLVVDIWRSDPSHVLATGTGSSSAHLRDGVLSARAYRDWRTRKDWQEGQRAGVQTAANGTGGQGTEQEGPFLGAGARLLAECRLEYGERAYLEDLARMLNLSGRGIMRALSVARTIADMEEKRAVGREHILEAVSFREKGGDNG